MKRNEPLLKVASYFWSNAFNAFIFGHGLMMITLADIFMLTGLRITGPLQPFNLLNKLHPNLGNLKGGGWTSYMANHKKLGTISEKEHVA